MTNAPEPEDKLDATTDVVVNGPEDAPFDWRQINWRRVEDEVRRLRQRIFTAAKAGDLARVRNLQKLMLRSRANTLLSVRRVTERNAGRLTAGVDGEVVLTPQAKADWPTGKKEGRGARDRRQSTSSSSGERVGARVGGEVRAEVLRVSAGPWLP